MKCLVKAPAKINLTLDVLHKRPDGYHEVEMVMTTIDLADRIELSDDNSSRVKLMSEFRFVPNDHRNLAYQAAELFRKRMGITRGVNIYLEKNIPVAAGLAGGSSDAAAVLRGLNDLWQVGLTKDELAIMGEELGSDVPFCVYGGTALSTGRGEKIQPLPAPPTCWVILAKPSIGVSTADIYHALKVNRIEHPNTKDMCKALEMKNYEQMCASVGNVLEPVTTRMHKEVKLIKDQMKRFGADAVLMSGSGPTVFGLVRHESRLHRIYNGLRGFCDQVYAVRLLGERENLA